MAGVIAWLSLLLGTILLDYFFGVNDMDFVAPILTLLVLSAFGLLLLTVFAGFAHDIQSKLGARQAHSMSG